MKDVDHRLRMPLSEYELSVRSRCALTNSDITTLAEVDAMTDDDLLRVPNMGRKSIVELRGLIRSIKFGALSLDDELVEWVHRHKILVTALVRGEAAIVPRG